MRIKELQRQNNDYISFFSDILTTKALVLVKRETIISQISILGPETLFLFLWLQEDGFLNLHSYSEFNYN